MYTKALPTPEEVKLTLTLSPAQKKTVQTFRKQIQGLLQKQLPQVALILGPCSIHHYEGALQYAKHLLEIAPLLHPPFFLVMRVFTQKPRTAVGWKGYTYDPFLDYSYCIEEGIYLTRKLMLELTSLQIPIATELLDPFLFPFFDDLISWGFIGARSCFSQIHRVLASQACFPVGFKNSIEGDIEGAILGAKVAQQAHFSLSISKTGRLVKIQTLGNQDTHIVLRGSTKQSNWDTASIERAIQQMELYQLNHPLLVDCSHGNAKKQEENQKEGFFATLEQILKGNSWIAGAMLESYLEKGNQPFIAPFHPYLSVTDRCLSWKETYELLLQAKNLFTKKSYFSSNKTLFVQS